MSLSVHNANANYQAYTPPPKAAQGPVERVGRPVNSSEQVAKPPSQAPSEPRSIEGELLQAGEFILEGLPTWLADISEREGGESPSQNPFRVLVDPQQAGEEPSAGSSSGKFAFADLRSALDYWESLNPQRTDPAELPIPIATYREVESGPTPRLGLSAYA